MKTDWRKQIIYQIYPRSFKDTNADGIGDIPGIIEKAGYLTDLGITAVWLSPVYPSPMADFGYDVMDFENIDPIFGTLDDFDRLIETLHQKNIKLIMDFIPNHSSNLHPWFLESRSSKTNPKRNWYIWKDPKPDGSPPNNWLSVFGGSAWTFDKKTSQYYLHTFLAEQPDLNWRNPEVIHAMQNVMRFWLRRGVDGFRIDAYNFIYKDQRYLDEPPARTRTSKNPYYALDHIYTWNQPEQYELIKTLEETVRPFGDILLVTENTKINFEQMIKLYRSGSHLHKPFNFFFLRLKWEAATYRKFIEAYEREVGHTHLPNYVLSNHDQPRIATRIGVQEARCAAMLQLTLRGVPTIYYGDELGLENAVIPLEHTQDPFEKNVPGLGLSRDPSRTPFLWDSGTYAGFSDTMPWLPLHTKRDNLCAGSQGINPHSFLNLYKKLIHLHTSSDVITLGTYQTLPLHSSTIYGYLREYSNQKIAVIIQFAEKEETLKIPFKGTILFNTRLDRQSEPVQGTLRIGPVEGVIIYVES